MCSFLLIFLRQLFCFDTGQKRRYPRGNTNKNKDKNSGAETFLWYRSALRERYLQRKMLRTVYEIFCLDIAVPCSRVPTVFHLLSFSLSCLVLLSIFLFFAVPRHFPFAKRGSFPASGESLPCFFSVYPVSLSLCLFPINIYIVYVCFSITSAYCHDRWRIVEFALPPIISFARFFVVFFFALWEICATVFEVSPACLLPPQNHELNKMARNV